MRRRIISAFICILLLSCSSISALAADAEEPSGPVRPVEISEEDSAEDTVYFSGNPNARLPLTYGSLTISRGGTLIATGTGATYASETCTVIKLVMNLYKYDPNTGVSTYLDRQIFYEYNAVHCAGSYNFAVPCSGYYFLMGVHNIANETKYTQTNAIYIY